MKNLKHPIIPKEHLSIDIETFSSVDLKTCGLYKYVESPDFEILLFAYSLNGSDVQIIDLKNGAKIPLSISARLHDEKCLKHAYNAPFEWACLSKYLGRKLPISQWRCTMLHGLYCGYTAGLDATGKALGLEENKQKLATGRTLIRYFCVPCKPSNVNGGRTRNLPHHDPEKWQLFKDYCKQDVVTEMEIERQLSCIPVPDFVQKEWETDLKINSRGVAVDLKFVNGALEIGATAKEELFSEAVTFSGLDNPNSRSQLLTFLENELNTDLSDLRKATVETLLKSDLQNKTAKRILELRQELSKTSTKKYDSILSCAGSDSRVRGLLQFYGANRTGRWAGRLAQVQNLPRTYVYPLEFAKELITNRKKDTLNAVYGSVFDTLSQMIRTAFVAEKDKVLIDADFSAIEARVISWLAGEEWRLEVFRTHGKIYEASASQMFGVPLDLIKKDRPEYALRQKGKVAELALGYQGSTGALIQMGALDMGLSEEELPDIVSRWRESNKRIRDLWYAVDGAAVHCIKYGDPVGVRGLLFSLENYGEKTCMSVLLPSGRKIYYIGPKIGVNKWNNPSITYLGVGENKRWTTIETYGGKLVENIVQAIARDCLAVAIERLESAGFEVVFHIHDEVVIECEPEKADLEKVIKIMSEPIPWAKDLPLNADGWVGTFFKKD